MTNCYAINCGDGLVIGKNSKVEVNGFTSINSLRHGAIIDENSEVTLNKFTSIGSGGAGVVITDTNLINIIGLPTDTDISELQKLLKSLQETPAPQREKLINESFLSGANNLTSIVNNILQILPNLPQL